MIVVDDWKLERAGERGVTADDHLVEIDAWRAVAILPASLDFQHAVAVLCVIAVDVDDARRVARREPATATYISADRCIATKGSARTDRNGAGDRSVEDHFAGIDSRGAGIGAGPSKPHRA